VGNSPPPFWSDFCIFNLYGSLFYPKGILMKNFTLVCASVVMSAMLTFAMGSTSEASRGRFDAVTNAEGGVEVTLQNKCTRDVKYQLKSGGTTTNGVVAKGDKVKVSVASGTEICVDGDAFMTVAAADAGQTFMVCR
jgi:hypothetical protein